MSTSHTKRRNAENRERAEATVPTQRWWIGVLTWVVVALGVGAISMLLVPGSIQREPDKLTLARYLAVALFNVLSMFGLTYYAARQTLARRSVVEIWRLPSNKRALNRVGLPLFLTALGLVITTSMGFVSESLYNGLLTFSTIFAIYRALTTAYTGHYFDYVASVQDKKEFETDRELKSKKRRFFERAAVLLGVRFPRERLIMPIIQTILVAFALRFVFSSVWTTFGGDATKADSIAIIQLISPMLTALSVVVWGYWHLYGGFTKIVRIGKGRPMKSFGWKNRHFTKEGKRV